MPHTAKIYPDHVSLVLSGNVTVKDVAEIAAFLTKLEGTSKASLHRYVDVTAVKEMQVNFRDLHELSTQRAKVKLKNRVKTAVVAETNEQYGMARMFELLNQQRDTEVAVFRNAATALRWLKLQPDANAPAKKG